MPIGEYPYTIDDKGRVVMPPSFRNFVPETLYITRGLEGCLYVFAEKTWNQIESALSDLPLVDSTGQAFVRFFYSGAKKDALDGQGRISIPSTLRDFAELKSDVIVAGAPNRLEIWDLTKWMETIREIQKRPPIQELLPDALRKLIG